MYESGRFLGLRTIIYNCITAIIRSTILTQIMMEEAAKSNLVGLRQAHHFHLSLLHFLSPHPALLGVCKPLSSNKLSNKSLLHSCTTPTHCIYLLHVPICSGFFYKYPPSLRSLLSRCVAAAVCTSLPLPLFPSHFHTHTHTHTQTNTNTPTHPHTHTHTNTLPHRLGFSLHWPMNSAMWGRATWPARPPAKELPHLQELRDEG